MSNLVEHLAEQDRITEEENERGIANYHAGWAAHRSGLARPTDKDGAYGWDERARSCKVRVIMPPRPEGYYHAPLGTFEE